MITLVLDRIRAQVPPELRHFPKLYSAQLQVMLMPVMFQRIYGFVFLLMLCSASSAQLLIAQDGSKLADVVAAADDDDDSDKIVKEPPVKEGWQPLIKGESLDGWEVTQFGGEGEVEVKNGEIVLGMGDPLTGITWRGKEFPKSGFEIKLEAKRIQGTDFLCGLTFPVGDKHASLIGGGWGGGVVGLSSVDGNDASENSTSTFRDFDNGKWYSFRVRVDQNHITAWVDDERIFKQERKGRDFSVRAEVMSSRPLGFCVFQSKVAVRNLAWRPLKGEEQEKKANPDKPTSNK